MDTTFNRVAVIKRTRVAVVTKRRLGPSTIGATLIVTQRHTRGIPGAGTTGRLKLTDTVLTIAVPTTCGFGHETPGNGRCYRSNTFSILTGIRARAGIAVAAFCNAHRCVNTPGFGIAGICRTWIVVVTGDGSPDTRGVGANVFCRTGVVVVTSTDFGHMTTPFECITTIRCTRIAVITIEVKPGDTLPKRTGVFRGAYVTVFALT